MTGIHIRRLAVGSLALIAAAIVPIAQAQERSRSFSSSSVGGLPAPDTSALRAEVDALRDRASGLRSATPTTTVTSPDGRARATASGQRASVSARSGNGTSRSASRASSGNAGAVRSGPSIERSVTRSRQVTRSRTTAR